MVGLFDVDMRTINEYLSNVDNPAELERETTVRKTLTCLVTLWWVVGGLV